MIGRSATNEKADAQQLLNAPHQALRRTRCIGPGGLPSNGVSRANAERPARRCCPKPASYPQGFHLLGRKLIREPIGDMVEHAHEQAGDHDALSGLSNVVVVDLPVS